MKNAFKPLTAVLLALALSATACGADEVSTVAGADSDQSPDATQEDNSQDQTNQDDADQEDRDLPAFDQPNSEEDETEGQEPTAEPASDSVNGEDPADNPSLSLVNGLKQIGTANIGGEIVSPRHHEIVEWGTAESYPEQLQVTFIGGDENCLAATATAHVSEDDTQIIVLLTTGITTDALTRSCLAGEFEHHLNMQLDVGIDGREIVMPGVPDPEPEPATPAPQAFEETLVGMSEESAIEGAESFGYSVRVVERDGEFFAVTEDYRTDRINVVINNGVVASASIG